VNLVARKTFVIDTNVLLHDPNAIKNFQDNDVVIPLIVLEELDSLKRLSNELGNNARDVIRYIDSLKTHHKGDLSKGVKIPEGPTVRIHLEIKSDRASHFPLPLDRNSNKILSMAQGLRQKGERIVFVSKDFVSRVKAEAMELEAEDYENQKVTYEKMNRGIHKLEVDKKDLDQFYKEGGLDCSADFNANEYCNLVTPDKISVLAKYNKMQKRLEPLIPIPKSIWGIAPLNMEQRCAIDLLLRDDVHLVTLIGQAGTGKTLLALACGMKQVFDDSNYSRILVSRPIVPLGKDIGYLPGTKEEKLFSWMQPIYDNLEFLCENANGPGNGKDSIEFIMESKKIEMEAVTYIRGRSLPKIYMIIDEAQNLTPHEVKTVISRAGHGTKVILTGDASQIDNPYLDRDSNGLTYTVSRFRNQKVFGHMFLDKTERSELAAIAAEVM
jgi:PhoH-like ATPase